MKSIMDELKVVLMFIGFALHGIIIYMAINFAYFFVAIAVTVAVFLLGLKLTGGYGVFIVYMVIFAIINYKLRSKMVYKNQLWLDLCFLHFLDKNQDFIKQNPGPEAAAFYASIKSNLAGLRAWFISPLLTSAFVSSQLKLKSSDSIQEAVTAEQWKTMKRIRLSFLGYELVLFLIIFLPFGLISFLYTIGISFPFQVLIYLLGFFFTYFLYSVIVQPILGLLILLRSRLKRS